MKIVIDIQEDLWNKVNNTFPISEGYRLAKCVKNGTPLPKGHGRLKDVDSIKTAFPNGEYVRTESVRATIDHEETIIEADDGGKRGINEQTSG